MVPGFHHTNPDNKGRGRQALLLGSRHGGQLHAGGPTPEKIYNSQNRFSNIMRLMRDCPQPSIVAVHGPYMSARLLLALAADVRLASYDATLQ